MLGISTWERCYCIGLWINIIMCKSCRKAVEGKMVAMLPGWQERTNITSGFSNSKPHLLFILFFMVVWCTAANRYFLVPTWGCYVIISMISPFQFQTWLMCGIGNRVGKQWVSWVVELSDREWVEYAVEQCVVTCVRLLKDSQDFTMWFCFVNLNKTFWWYLLIYNIIAFH